MPPPPPLPRFRRRLEIAGFTLGHASDLAAKTGVTVILCPDGALAAADLLGSATGTRQFDSLVSAVHVASKAHALVFAGGSGYGLATAEPVVAHLARQGKGFRTPLGPVPIVPTAILFDLGFGGSAWPAQELAERAIAGAAAGPVACGSVGAGTGATVGKARGLDCAMKGGFGFAAVVGSSGVRVAAAVAVNAFGDVRDPATGRILAGCRSGPRSRRLAGADRVLAALPADAPDPWAGNTTLVAVLTDAALDKPGALKVCQMAASGLHRTLLPALSQYDGDLVATLASGRIRAHVHQVGVLAQLCVGEAIATAVREADGFGLLPAVRDLH